MIADMRGFTRFTQERGDEAAADLSNSFAKTTRRVAILRDGLLLELRGDEALVVFDSARQAIRAALELHESLRGAASNAEACLPVGIGLDAGEAATVQDGFRGGALNLAGRLCAIAAAGETLASEAVVHLAGRLPGVTFRERPPVQLKGLHGRVRPIEVSAADEVVLDRRHDIKPPPKGPRGSRKHRVGALLAGLVVLAGVAVTFMLGRAPAPAPKAQPTLAPDQVVNFDPATGKVLAHVRSIHYHLGSGHFPRMVFGEGGVWAFDEDGIAHIDPENGDVRHVALQGVGDDIAVGGLGVWVTDSSKQLSRVDPATDLIVRRIRLESISVNATIAAGEGSIWVTSSDLGMLRRVNAATNQTVATIANLGAPIDVAIRAGSVWVLDGLGGQLLRIDPDLNEVVDQVSVPGQFAMMAVDQNGVWILDGDGIVTRIASTDLSVRDTVRVGNYPTDIKACIGAVWVANFGDGTISRIDPVTATVETLDVNGPVAALVCDPASGTLWLQLINASVPRTP